MQRLFLPLQFEIWFWRVLKMNLFKCLIFVTLSVAALAHNNGQGVNEKSHPKYFSNLAVGPDFASTERKNEHVHGVEGRSQLNQHSQSSGFSAVAAEERNLNGLSGVVGQPQAQGAFFEQARANVNGEMRHQENKQGGAQQHMRSANNKKPAGVSVQQFHHDHHNGHGDHHNHDRKLEFTSGQATANQQHFGYANHKEAAAVNGKVDNQHGNGYHYDRKTAAKYDQAKKNREAAKAEKKQVIDKLVGEKQAGNKIDEKGLELAMCYLENLMMQSRMSVLEELVFPNEKH